jgi:hypothetical protein
MSREKRRGDDSQQIQRESTQKKRIVSDPALSNCSPRFGTPRWPVGPSQDKITKHSTQQNPPVVQSPSQGNSWRSWARGDDAGNLRTAGSRDARVALRDLVLPPKPRSQNIPHLLGGMAELAARHTGTETVVAD